MSGQELIRVQRPARGEPDGLLVLHHGRGADEHDLLGLGAALDPEHRLTIVCPRAPLTLPGWGGYHWYLVPRVGYPDPVSFAAARALLAQLHDELWEQTGIGPERTVLGGFSMGAVMSYALALDGERPPPAGILALSGFIPQVEGWSAQLASRVALRAFIAHGRADGVIDVSFGRSACRQLTDAGLQVEYHESQAGHHVDPAQLPAAIDWLAGTLGPHAGAGPMAGTGGSD